MFTKNKKLRNKNFTVHIVCCGTTHFFWLILIVKVEE